MSNNHSQIKVLAASLLMVASWSASAAIGNLQVQSGLNEPFSATVVVTGDEARALTAGRPTVTGADLSASVLQQSGDRAVVRLQSAAPVKEPMLTFWLSVGNQNRQYTAMLDPRDYRSPSVASASGSRERGAVAERRSERRAEVNAPKNNTRVARERQARRAPAEIISGNAYQVKDGELLVNIAERVQPAGVTLRQTINAIVRLNPQSFRNRNPDLMYRGTTLIIPDEAQLRRVAQNPRLAVRAQNAGGAAVANLPERTSPATSVSQPAVPAKPAESVAPATQPAPSAPAKVETPAPAPAASEAPAPVAPPVETPVVASEPAAPSAPLASEPLQVASEVAASAAVSEPVVSVPEASPVPAPAPQVEAPPVADESPVEEGSGLMTWLPYGAGAAVLGGLAYYFLQRRRQTGAVEQGEKIADNEVLFDEDDNDAVVIEERAEVSDEQLHVDLSDLMVDQHLGNTPDGGGFAAASNDTIAPAAPAEDDWSWLEESSANNETSSQAATPAAAEAVGSSDDDWLDFGAESVATAAVEPAAPSSDALEEDLSWMVDVDVNDAPVAPQTEPQATQVAVEADDWLSDLDDLSSFNETAAAAPAAQAQEEQWNMDMDFTVDEPAPASVAVSSGFDIIADDLDLNLHFVDESAEPAVQIAQVTEPVVEPVIDTVETADLGNWDNLNLDDVTDSASSSSAPLPQEALEAKLELARMYLEIDDANTARQTLMELVNEASGTSIQAQAQALLNELS